jgi:predicted metal-dependent enzyme (double-stranded beta helix superfamily)
MTTSPALDRLIERVRALDETGLDAEAKWAAVEPALRELLSDPDVQAAAKTWPVCHDRTNRTYTNLLFYEDPDSGFVVNGLVKDESGNTAVHDHGENWVLYGLLEGEEIVTRYERVDDGSVAGRATLAKVDEFVLHAGDVDFVRPWSAHKERALSERTVAVIVRSANVGTSLRRRYDLARGTVELRPGPTQVPYPLE